MAVKIGGNDGNAGDEPKRLQAILVHRIVVGFRVETPQRGQGGANGVHRQGVRRKFLDDIDDSLGQLAFPGQQPF